MWYSSVLVLVGCGWFLVFVGFFLFERGLVLTFLGIDYFFQVAVGNGK